MTTLGHGEDAARQMRNRFGLKVPPQVSAETFVLLHSHDEELALAAYELALGAVSPEGVMDLRFRRALLAKDWDTAMQVARSQPLLWMDFAERCERRTLARVGRIAARKAYARAPRVIGVEHEAHMRDGKLKDALKSGREIERDYAASHLGPERLAWTLALLGDVEGAVAAGDLAVARDGMCPRSAWARSLALALAGRWPDAEAEAERAHSIRAVGSGTTWADVVLEADRGGMLLEEVIAEHAGEVPVGREQARAYDAMRAHAARA
jgi:hypothetical protein